MGRNELVEPSRPFDVRDANPEMVDPAVLAQATVMNRLGAVPVGIEEGRAVVVLPILRARARRAGIALVGLDSGAPELVDVRARRGSKADVEPAGSLASPTWPARWRSRPTRRRVSARFRVCSGPGRRTAPMPGGPRRGASRDRTRTRLCQTGRSIRPLQSERCSSEPRPACSLWPTARPSMRRWQRPAATRAGRVSRLTSLR
jgi:hypothetical protein